MAPQFPFRSYTIEGDIVGMIFTSSHHTEYPLVSFWIVDSRLPSHITHSLHMFTLYRSLSNTFVTLPNNGRLHVSTIGIVLLNSNLVLQNVLYIPSFKIYFFPVGQLL